VQTSLRWTRCRTELGRQDVLQHLRISHRLAIAIAAPVIVVIGLAAHLIWVSWAERAEMAELNVLADGIGKISRLVHELQRERGMSAVFLSSKGAQMRDELSGQRKRTNDERQSVSAVLQTFAALDSRKIRDAVGNAETAVAALDGRRGDIDKQAIAAGDSSAYFTGAIDKLLSVTRSVAHLSSRVDVSTALSAYLSLTQGKEHAGQERAAAAGGITVGRFDLPGYRKLLAQIAAQDIHFAAFQAAAKSEEREFYERTLSGQVVDSFGKMREAIANGGLSGEMAGLDNATWFKAATARIDALKSVEDRVASDVMALTFAKRGDATREMITLASIIAVGLLVTVVLVLLMARSITRPIGVLSGAMKVLAGGDTSVAIEGTHRRDEIGGMAGAVQVFKDNMIEAERLRGERSAAEARMATQRKADMMKLADEFQQAIGGIVSTVSTASSQLEGSAGTLTSTARRAQEMATTVAAASEEASTNVQSVASATEELSSSVTEISRQVQESARMAGEAVTQARTTTERVSELSKAAARIGDVVDLINTIAGQTNLLALNATIEAARAGDAGRGFAVVASEVKALAEQTAKATGEIGQQITSIQAATGESVDAIKAISGTIERLSEVSSTIAAAVEEQGAATQEISRNVQQAAQGTQQVSSNIVDVQRGASDTGSASSQVLSAAQSLSGDSARLRQEVDKFLSSVRAA
jgi:methyl-accepting chemotaxis protein